jgi:glycosyltransferase involved in cell wall biosynthesis
MTGGIDSIDEYSRRLVRELAAAGIGTRYVADGPSALMSGPQPRWVLLEYNPFSYGRSGLAPGVVHDTARWRRRSRAPLAVMVHEAWIDMTDPKSTAIGLWQRLQLRALLRLADGVMTSTEALAREIGDGAVHVPVPATVTPVRVSRESGRQMGPDGKLAVALFGRDHPSRALDHAEAAIAALAESRGPSTLTILNLGVNAPPLAVPSGVEVASPGFLPAEELSRCLSASDVVLLPLVDGVSTRRTTLMAALAHGRPVIGLRGRNTDSMLAKAHDCLILTPVGDPAAFSRAAVALADNPERMRAMGQAARRFYEVHFDWPVTARRVASVLETLAAARSKRPTGANGGTGTPNGDAIAKSVRAQAVLSRRAREVVFVVRDLGGSGGMERHTEQLVTRLVDAGQPVTVIARTCKLEERSGLRFVRVPTPGRPFAVAYPAFFAVASLLVAFRRNSLVHSTGALIGNRVDVSTVHYCHRAAAARVEGSRASRPNPLFQMNAVLAGILSRAGESWCYRPGRARLLCAVSRGVAAELTQTFPEMARAVRTVPNGVDSIIFRPDQRARGEVRSKLGIDERTPLAVFVGGDWERKGLPHAVDALALAPSWHLAVAGAGDQGPIAARARQAGTEPRLRFLGPVREMPRVYAAGDAFVLPTAYEAFPLVALEAAASGLPLVVTHVNGIDELMEEATVGYVVTRDARDIAQRLNEVSSDPDRASRIGASARVAATRYTWEAMVNRYLSLYEELTRDA